MIRRRQPSSRARPLGAALIAGAIVFGTAAIAISFLGSAGAARQEAAVPGAFSGDPEATETYSPPALRRLSAAEAAPPPPATGPAPALDPTPSRVIREPAPVDALPATRARSVSGAQPTQRQTAEQAAGQSTGPFSVIVAVEAGSALAPLAAAVQKELGQRGTDARLQPVDAAGRPDALLSLDLLSGGGPDVWYCDVPSAGSRDLAAAALAALASMPSIPSDFATAPPLPARFDCEAPLAPRARTPAALVRLPSSLLSDPAASDAAVQALASGVDQYFKRYGAAARRARDAARLVWPATGAITSAYGPSHPLGIDIGQWMGDVLAASAGTVFWAGGDPCCSYGRFVVIDSPDGIRTVYAHLSSVYVKAGDKVRQGQPVGTVGCTGACFGVHLHFEVIDGGARQNPMGYLP